MKIILKITILSLFLLASCEKSTDPLYTLKFYGDAYEDIGYSVAKVDDGYVIAGQLEEITRSDNFISARNKNMGILKTDLSGNVIWKVSAGGKFNDFGSKIYQLTDGSLICAGTFTDTTTALPVQTNVFLVKISAAGAIEWQKTYGGAGNQTGKDILKTTDGFMVLGTTDVERQPLTDSTGNISGNTDLFLLRIKDNGDLVETYAYGFPGDDGKLGRAIIKPDPTGDFIILGTTDFSDPGKAKNNLILIRVNGVGLATESRIIGGVNDEYAADMEVLSNGYLLAGTVGKEGDEQQILITRLKTDIYATPYFSNTLEINDPDQTNVNSSGVYAISKYNEDSFILAGYTGKIGVGVPAKMLVFEIDDNGNPIEGNELIKGSTGTQIAYDVVSADDGSIITVGKNIFDVNSMIAFLKFRF
jgi:hypothetical protein